MSKEVNKDLVNAAVEYWAHMLEDPMSFVMDNGESSQFVLLNMMAKAGAKPAEEDAVEKFRCRLTNTIYEALEKNGRLTLSVDYDPDRILTEILDNSLSNYNSKTIFPCKTCMWITLENVSVSQGYHAPTVVLYGELPKKED